MLLNSYKYSSNYAKEKKAGLFFLAKKNATYFPEGIGKYNLGGKKMKTAVIGSGKIVPQVIDAMRRSGALECSAICGRRQSADKVRSLAEKYNIGKFYHYQHQK